MRVGVCLPTFHDDPARVLRLAGEAEEAGMDGVFLFDHLWHIAEKGRPALHGPTLMGAVAAVTDRIRIGSLVARVGVQLPAVLSAMFMTMDRMAPGRIIAGLGVGDALNREENLAFGLPVEERPQRLAELVDIARGLRAAGVEVWVGGTSESMWNVAAVASDAVNLWNTPVAMTRKAVERAAPAIATWAGLARNEVVGADLGEHLRSQAEAGAGWCVYAAAAGDVTMVSRLAEARARVGI